jgi:tRNA (adenine37-N6)-methyltransferase
VSREADRSGVGAPGGDLAMRRIGTVHGGRSDPIDDGWGRVTSRIELDPAELEESATTGLEAFSHVDVVYVFDRVDPSRVCTGARHPRGRADWPSVGILAQRAKDRPNRIGVTTCELVGVHGHVLELRGLDAVDGTPVLDVKPHLTGFDPRGPVREPAWATELMEGYW